MDCEGSHFALGHAAEHTVAHVEIIECVQVAYEFHDDVEVLLVMEQFIDFDDVLVAHSLQDGQFIFKVFLIYILRENLTLTNYLDCAHDVEFQVRGLLHDALRPLPQDSTKFDYIFDVTCPP